MHIRYEEILREVSALLVLLQWAIFVTIDIKGLLL